MLNGKSLVKKALSLLIVICMMLGMMAPLSVVAEVPAYSPSIEADTTAAVVISTSYESLLY